MKTCLHQAAAASLLVFGAALVPTTSIAGVRVCTFPGSPSAALDRAVAREAFKTAGIAASIIEDGIGEGDDDGVSLKELHKTLGRSCDAIAGFPQSSVADGSGDAVVLSRDYLRSGYVSVTTVDPVAQRGRANVVAATYASPAQLIAVQEQDVKLDLENTPERTVEAVATGHATRAIVWYPAVVAYTLDHPKQRFNVSATTSPYAEWRLVFAFGAKNAALQPRIDAALAKMAADGRLAALTDAWALPDSARTAQASSTKYAYLDGPVRSTGIRRSGVLASATSSETGGFVKVAAAGGDVPSFDKGQVAHGKKLYSSACAKCHGADLGGVNAPALRGPSFAPAKDAHLTIGGIYGYMATNMPADRPGKMKDEEYADIMAFLLFSNGYSAGGSKLTADAARASATPLNAGNSQ
ncbi:c-type cytochrome [Caballeronia humi]|uniref:Cytochrome c, class I n=1 Tax=Caballeronia humi TaxID=326474 RepID=A0A158IPT9_9BURK|nr:c-type cytochrome [Caballeronia humi]SAL58111.1 cytochrome c, class I [Caballeronia humi]